MFKLRSTFLFHVALIAGCLVVSITQAVSVPENQKQLLQQKRSTTSAGGEVYALESLQHMKMRHLAARQAGGSSASGGGVEGMPARCDSQCTDFNALLQTCSKGSETAQISCTCQSSTFDAMITCAMCAPDYYGYYKNGLRGFVENAEAQCAEVGHAVQVDTAALPTGAVSTSTARTTSVQRSASTASTRSSTPEQTTSASVPRGIGAAALNPTVASIGASSRGPMGGAFDSTGAASTSTTLSLRSLAGLAVVLSWLL